MTVPIGSPLSARVKLPGTNPLIIRMLCASRPRDSNSSTTGSIGSVGSFRAISSAVSISEMNSASGSVFGSAV